MTTFLKVCLLLGVAAALIPSAFGLQCVVCGPSSAGGVGIDCAKYKPGDDSYEQYCASISGDPLCSTTTVKNMEVRGCGSTAGGGGGKAGECNDLGGGVKRCYCGDNLCNKPPKAGGGDDSGGGRGGRCNGGSGQQLGLKGGSFGSLGMVLLGGVGLIRGQLWG